MKIEFIAGSKEAELVVPPPSPAKNFVPEWYKKITRFNDENKPIFDDGKILNHSIKGCVPFYDAMTNGYIQETWCDIHFEFIYENNNLNRCEYNFASGPRIISSRENSSIPTSNEFHPVEFIWTMPWMPVVPRGWSVFFTNPLNHFSQYFNSLSGIIDSDVFFHSFNGNFPFYIKKNYNNFIIPAGTPMYQMIPFKRENWESEVKNISDVDRYILDHKKRKHYISGYKKFFHQKKSFK